MRPILTLSAFPILSPSKQHHGAVEYTAKAIEDNATRSAMTTISYLLTPDSPKGHFYRNKSRTVHTLHKGRRRVCSYSHERGATRREDQDRDVCCGTQYRERGKTAVVEGDIYKAGYLLPQGREVGLTGGRLHVEVSVSLLRLSKWILLNHEYRRWFQALSSVITTS